MKIALIYYLSVILALRLVFYFLPRHRNLPAYAILIAFEVGVLWAILEADYVTYGVLTALVVFLGLFAYVLETKLTDTRSTQQTPGALEPMLYLGLALSVAAISLVFFAGRPIALRPEVAGWLPAKRWFPILLLTGLLTLSETRHLIGFLTRKLRAAAGLAGGSPGAEQIIGICERLMVFGLAVLAQFPAAAIVILGRSMLAALAHEDSREARVDLATGFLSVSLALLAGLVFRTLLR